MKIKVLSKAAAEAFTSESSWAAISISTSKDYWAVLSEENRTHLLQMEFWDFDRQLSEYKIFPGSEEYDNAILFDQKLAIKAWDFVFEVQDEVDTLLIHCEAGVSRSPAMAAAIEKTLLGDDQKWFDQSVPNMLVFREMLNQAHERGLIS